MKTALVIFGMVLHFFGTYSLIIPNQIGDLFAVIFTNIPTIKKGTDSRVGWGFRFGDRADFQVMVELGPQTNTQPLANQGSGTSSKRNVANNLRNVLYAQQQDREKQISNTDGGRWLDQWSDSMRNVQQTQTFPAAPKPGLGIGEVDAKAVILDDSTLILKDLYECRQCKATKPTTTQQLETISSKDATEAELVVSGDPTSLILEKLYGQIRAKGPEEIEVVKSTTQKPKTTTSFKEALDNVDMDETK